MESGRYSRGYLPHLNVEGAAVFLTWRLGDALPAHVVESMRKEVLELPESSRRSALWRKVEAYADAGAGSCILRDGRVALAVQETLFYDHGRRFELIAWAIMPNHVHLLLRPVKGSSLAKIVSTQKSLSTKRINRLLGGSGSRWDIDYFDRVIRSGQHMERTRRYIEWNPVKARLCADPALWPWSSANPHARAGLEHLLKDE